LALRIRNIFVSGTALAGTSLLDDRLRPEAATGWRADRQRFGGWGESLITLIMENHAHIRAAEQLFGLSQFPKVPVTWIFEHWLYWRRACVLWANDKLRASLRIFRGSFPHSQLSDTVRRPHIDPPKTLKLDTIFKYFNLQNHHTASVSHF